MIARVSEGYGTNIVQCRYQHCSPKVPTLFSAKSGVIVHSLRCQQMILPHIGTISLQHGTFDLVSI